MPILMMMSLLQHLRRKLTRQVARLLYSVVTAAAPCPVFASRGSSHNIPQNLVIPGRWFFHLEHVINSGLAPHRFQFKQFISSTLVLLCDRPLVSQLKSPTPDKETAHHFCWHPCPTNACHEPLKTMLPNKDWGFGRSFPSNLAPLACTWKAFFLIPARHKHCTVSTQNISDPLWQVWRRRHTGTRLSRLITHVGYKGILAHRNLVFWPRQYISKHTLKKPAPTESFFQKKPVDSIKETYSASFPRTQTEGFWSLVQQTGQNPDWVSTCQFL